MTSPLPEHSVGLTRPRPALCTVKAIASLWWLVLCAIAAAVLLGLQILKDLHAPVWVWWLCSGPWVLFCALSVVRSVFFVKNHAWMEGEEDFLVCRGAWWRTVTAVPYGRIQYATVSQGPLMRAFGLAKVELHSAAPAMDATVEGLSMEEAEKLKEHLVAVGAARLAGL